MTTPVPAEHALTPEVLESLANELNQLRAQATEGEAKLAPHLERVHPENMPSARNLVHYLVLRRRDIRDLQQRLARAGLSSLGRSEPHVLVTLDRMIALLALARGENIPEMNEPPVGFREGEQVLAGNAADLLGPSPPNRNVRIVVTLPREAAEDAELADDLIAAGMDCARINCARGDADDWSAMADNIITARRRAGRECRILVDLAGPKLRTTPIAGQTKPLRLFVGNRFELVREGSDEPRKKRAPPRIGCTADEVFADADTGQPIWFDDGKIGGVIEER